MKYDAPAGYARVSDILSPFYRDMIDGYFLRRGSWCGDSTDIIALGGQLDEATLDYGRTPQIMPNGNVESWLPFVLRYQELIESERFRNIFSRCLAVQEESINEVEKIIGHSDQRWALIPYAFDMKGEAIIDIKTGAPRKAVALQLAAYDLGTPIPKRRRRFSIHLTAEKAVLTEWKDSRDYDAFRLAARWFHRSRDYQ